MISLKIPITNVCVFLCLNGSAKNKATFTRWKKGQAQYLCVCTKIDEDEIKDFKRQVLINKNYTWLVRLRQIKQKKENELYYSLAYSFAYKWAVFSLAVCQGQSSLKSFPLKIKLGGWFGGQQLLLRGKLAIWLNTGKLAGRSWSWLAGWLLGSCIGWLRGFQTNW